MGDTSWAAALARIEEYYDEVPRAVTTTEEVGPFTLFVAEEGTGWQYYARPRLHGTRPFTPADLKVRATRGLRPALNEIMSPRGEACVHS